MSIRSNVTNTSQVKEIQMNPDDQAEFKMPKVKTYFWFFIIWLTMVLDYMDRQALAALLPILKKEFLLTDAQAGGLISILTIVLGIAVFPLAFLMDKWGRDKITAAMVFVWSIATWITGRCKSYSQLLFVRGTVGLGESGYGPASTVFISTWFPKSMRGRMTGLLSTATVIGNSVGVALVGYIAYKYGWRSVFGILTIPGIILAITFLFMPDFKVAKVEKGETKASKVKLADVFKYVIKTKALLAIYLVGAALYCVNISIVSWAPSYFSRTFGMNVKVAAAMIGIMGLLAAAGAILFGLIGDYFVKKTPRGRVLTNIGLSILMVLCIILALNSKAYMVVVVLWGIAWASMSGMVANNNSACLDLSPLNMRGSAYSIIAVCNQLIGSSIGPLVSGILSDKLGLKMALASVTVGCTVILLLCSGIAAMYFNGDIKKMNSIAENYKLQ